MIIAILITFFFIILRFSVTLFNFISNPKLHRVGKQYQDRVSVLIPARNEAGNISALLWSIQAQDYQNYEVIILDDESTDDTYAVCSAFAAHHSRFRVIKGGKLPDGWIGKNHACHQLAQHADGKYLLFLDADEVVKPGLINSAVHRMHLHQLGLLSLFANQQMITPGEKTVVPLMHFILLNLLPVRLIYLLRNAAVAAASGQFMLFDAGIYHQHQWHKAVKNKVVEDVEIMKLVKARAYNGEALLANGMISCRMYKSYREAVNGFGKNFLAAFNYSIIGFLIYIVLTIGGPMIVIMTLSLPLIFFMAGLIMLTRIMISLLSGQSPVVNILLHPLQMLSMLVIAVVSIQKYLTKTTVWKGRKI
ncbi:glycosyltransferase [Mucilaginibacter pocheonensis]|uniref:Chlorobactene glucosyltransferase n=1 Tax=Mucilaginibacter pocheonensis TaxID=398050 RepID=A0ABU1TAG9_9SPHI|nr:glycosyltransferase family 2 protein [Mucilaginibacter pocheonensis]MDR6942397.1 chlorobactene glucosyltransferase [Mucilaginibacter pocheonensis]